MYICLCRGITDNQVQQAIEQGVRCNKELNQMVGAPPVCGACGPETKALIRQGCMQREVTTEGFVE